jgi:hypothetical protein
MPQHLSCFFAQTIFFLHRNRSWRHRDCDASQLNETPLRRIVMQVTQLLDEPNRNPDPITDAPGSHPVGTGVGGVGGAVAGAAVGIVGGPVGMAIGAAVGAIAGGLAGKAVAESVNPTVNLARTGEVLDASELEAVAYAPILDAIPTATVSGSVAVLTPLLARDRETIARHAYFIWERKGRTDGHALDDWLQAEWSLMAGL